MGVLLNRRRYMGASHGDDIVTDINGVEYKVVNYIATPGSGTIPMIDTGFKANQDTYLEMKCSNGNGSTTAYNGIFVYGAEKPRFALRFVSGELRFDYNTSMTYNNYRFSGGSEIVIKHDKNNLYINDTLIVQATYPDSGFVTPYTVYLCGLHRNETIYYAPLNFIINYCKIKDNGTFIRDYIPVSRVNDGEYGLFDKINLIYYTSVNGGSFLGG